MAAPAATTLTIGSLSVPAQGHRKALTLQVQPASRFPRPSLASQFVGPNASESASPLPLSLFKPYWSTPSGASFKAAVASIDSDQLSSSSDPVHGSSKVKEEEEEEQQQQGGSGKYYFVVANAKFMLDEEEHFKELLFERLRHYGERSKEQDFWLVIEPNFLDKFPNITKRLRRPAVALVSTNAPWITFMKLRLDRVLSESYEADSLEEALASNPTDIEFEKPENWTAPYPKYEFGWWEPFLPPAAAAAAAAANPKL